MVVGLGEVLDMCDTTTRQFCDTLACRPSSQGVEHGYMISLSNLERRLVPDLLSNSGTKTASTTGLVGQISLDNPWAEYWTGCTAHIVPQLVSASARVGTYYVRFYVLLQYYRAKAMAALEPYFVYGVLKLQSSNLSSWYLTIMRVWPPFCGWGYRSVFERCWLMGEVPSPSPFQYARVITHVSCQHGSEI